MLKTTTVALIASAASLHAAQPAKKRVIGIGGIEQKSASKLNLNPSGGIYCASMTYSEATTRSFCTILCLWLAAAISNATAQTNPTWLGRPFVKVVHTGDPIPDANGAIFNELTWFTLRDGTIHLVGGESSTRKGIFRWRTNTLTSLVYTNTLAPTGAKFDTVHVVTDETSGALNFGGEVYFGNPGAIYGLFELRNGTITTVFDNANPNNGLTYLGFGYPVRVGNEVVGGGLFITNGVQKQGVFRWNGTTLNTLLDSETDLPGSLGNYGGSPAYSFTFDGQTVAFIASAGFTANAPRGVYQSAADGTLTKVVDVNDVIPGDRLGRTYLQRNRKFVTVDVDGTNTFFDTSGMVAAAGGNRNQFYNLGTRVTDGVPEDVLGAFINGQPPQLDGREISTLSIVDGHGDDVAFMVHFIDGSRGIYAAIGPVTPSAPILILPARTNGLFRFQFSTQAGQNYRVDFKATLADADWLPRSTLPGTGSDVVFSEPATNAAGFYRVTLLP